MERRKYDRVVDNFLSGKIPKDMLVEMFLDYCDKYPDKTWENIFRRELKAIFPSFIGPLEELEFVNEEDRIQCLESELSLFLRELSIFGTPLLPYMEKYLNNLTHEFVGEELVLYRDIALPFLLENKESPIYWYINTERHRSLKNFYGTITHSSVAHTLAKETSEYMSFGRKGKTFQKKKSRK